MADKRSLQIIGWIFGAITAAVISVAAVGLVNASDGRTDDARPVDATIAPSAR